ncbi:MAG: hypothetical protein K2J48_01710 [Muribaculaceae bacterium]|nr:hypothetical protein [Muribaculaceae bacterium]
MLIQDNKTLCRYIPNVFTQHIPDSPTLFDKIQPYLEMAHQWLYSLIIDDDFIKKIIDNPEPTYQQTQIKELAISAVALKAWSLAIPALDVLITQNGVGVAETQTIKPASKAKIDALISSVKETLDQTICRLFDSLFLYPGWSHTYNGSYYTRTLFCSCSQAARFPDNGDKFTEDAAQKFFSHVLDMKRIQQNIATDWISNEVMEALLLYKYRSQNINCFTMIYGKKNDPVPAHLSEQAPMIIMSVINDIQNAIRLAMTECGAVLDMMHSGVREAVEHAVSTIRSNQWLFRAYRGSYAEKLSRIKNFKNESNNTAYWL